MSGRKLALASGCQMDWSRECKRSKVILRTSVESSDKQDQSRVTVVGAEEIPNMFSSDLLWTGPGTQWIWDERKGASMMRLIVPA